MRRPGRSSANMAFVFVLVPALVAAFAAAEAAAAPSPPRSDPPPSTQPSAQPAANAPAPQSEEDEKNRALAESEYKKGYKDSEEAKKLKKDGKDAAAKERFTKALKHFEEAVKIHDAYAEGWNMVGFCRRNLGDMRHAFDAYDRSLALNPDYDEAHEYLGELYAMQGMLEKAREQLTWLQNKKSDEAEELAEAIEAAEKSKGKKGAAAAEPTGTASAPAGAAATSAPAGGAPADSGVIDPK